MPFNWMALFPTPMLQFTSEALESRDGAPQPVARDCGLNDMAFGPFRLSMRRRELQCQGERVSIGSRAFDLLGALVMRAGEVVSVPDLMSSVWPGLVVAEGTVRVHIVSLRRLLGAFDGEASYIVNVPSRGYSFVGDLGRERAAPRLRLPDLKVGGQLDAPKVAMGLPQPLLRMLGRESDARNLVVRLLDSGFVTVVGPAGMGKTCLAIKVGHLVAEVCPQGALHVDLSSAVSGEAVQSMLLRALGEAQKLSHSTEDLIAALRRRPTLLILDGCEHVLTHVAPLAERIFGETDARILATSREPLWVEGESIYRLAGLPAPAGDIALAPTDALAYPAVKLFVDRLVSARHDFEFTQAQVSCVSRVCRRLEGVPLAIELVAGMAGLIGLDALEDMLDGRARLSWQGRRTATLRHQTLRGMLDWSYQLLSDEERQVLHAVASFDGSFSAQEAERLVSDASFSPDMMDGVLAGLVAKSLACLEFDGDEMRYRLLEMTRTYMRHHPRAMEWKLKLSLAEAPEA